MNDDTWHLYLLNLAAMDSLVSRPAIRSLYYAGCEVEWIAEAADIPIERVQDALRRIP